MTERYLITWEIEADAESPVDAAMEAWEAMKDPLCVGWTFTVLDRVTGLSKDLYVER